MGARFIALDRAWERWLSWGPDDPKCRSLSCDGGSLTDAGLNLFFLFSSLFVSYTSRVRRPDKTKTTTTTTTTSPTTSTSTSDVGGSSASATTATSTVTLEKCCYCKYYLYCGKDCQLSHWYHTHMNQCRHLKKLWKYYKPYAKSIFDLMRFKKLLLYYVYMY